MKNSYIILNAKSGIFSINFFNFSGTSEKNPRARRG
jgi:hypothetical protein